MLLSTMNEDKRIMNAEHKLLLMARYLWMRIVYEKKMMPALGINKVSGAMIALAQVSSLTTQKLTSDTSFFELALHEVDSELIANAVHLFQQRPQWDPQSRIFVSQEALSSISDQLELAHRVLHSLDTPATCFEVLHRLAHLAPDATSFLGRVLSLEAPMRHVGHVISVVAQRAGPLISHLGLGFGIGGLVVNSMALHKAIAENDSVTRATSGTNVVTEATSCSLIISSLIAASFHAHYVAVILSTAALPVSVAALGLPSLVKFFAKRKLLSVKACKQLLEIVEALTSPLELDSKLGAHVFNSLAPISSINFRSKAVTLGEVTIEKNTSFLLNSPVGTKEDLDVLDALDLSKVVPLTGTETTLTLPSSSKMHIDWQTHFTAYSFAHSSCEGIGQVSKFKGKGFSFSNGLHAVHGIKTTILSDCITTVLDNQDRTFNFPEENVLPQKIEGKETKETNETKTFDVCYTFVGGGGKTILQLELSRPPGKAPIIELKTDGDCPSTWILRCKLAPTFDSCSEENWTLAIDDVKIVITDPVKNLLFFVYDEIVFSWDFKQNRVVPKVVLPSWISSRKSCLMDELKKLCKTQVVELQDLVCVDSDGQDVVGAFVYYDPDLKEIRAETLSGFHYVSKGVFEGEFCDPTLPPQPDGVEYGEYAIILREAMVFELESIDLSKVQNLDFHLLNRHVKTGRLSIYVSHLSLHGYYDSVSGSCVLMGQNKNLYSYSKSISALVGVGRSFLEKCDVVQEVEKLLAEFSLDPALSLFPNNQYLLAEKLTIADVHNMWILPFEKKIASASSLEDSLVLCECVQDSAIFFNSRTGAIYSSLLSDLDCDLEYSPPLHEFHGYGEFSKVEKCGVEESSVLATTTDGLVFRFVDAFQLELLEKMWMESDSTSLCCLRCGVYLSQETTLLLPVTEKGSGIIKFFVDVRQELTIDTLNDHKTSDVNYLGQIGQSHIVFSSKRKKVLKMDHKLPSTELFTCDFALRLEDVLLLFDPAPPFDVEKLSLMSSLSNLNSLILATSLKNIRVDYSFHSMSAKRVVLDPLIKTSPVIINFHCSENFSEVDTKHDVVFSSGDQCFVIHQGQRENIMTVNLFGS